MIDRELILAALPAPKGGSPPPTCKIEPYAGRNPVEVFKERFTALGGEIVPFDQVSTIASSFFVDSTAKIDLSNRVQNVWEAEAGVTGADCAIAETGSIVVSAKPGSSRLASLAPPVHVVLLDPGDIVPTLDGALSLIPTETSVVITGPSRTADIEGVLVRGVHGPKRVIVVFLPPKIPV